MSIYVAVVCARSGNALAEKFSPKNFDILMHDVKLNTGVTKQLPQTNINPDEDPQRTALKFLFHMTASASTRGYPSGIQGLRAVHVPHDADSGTRQRRLLYVITVSDPGELNEGALKFHSFEFVLKTARTYADQVTYDDITRFFLDQLDQWFSKASSNSSIKFLFSPASFSRLDSSSLNPAFAVDFSVRDDVNSEALKLCHEALTKLIQIEKCDLVLFNPLYGSDLLSSRPDSDPSIDLDWLKEGDMITLSDHEEREHQLGRDFPLHRACREGNLSSLRKLLNDGHSPVARDRDSWTPLHYAAWHGHAETVRFLLKEIGCQPNNSTVLGESPLHLAAMQGFPGVVKVLLSHPDIDVYMENRSQATPLDLCSSQIRPEWQQCAQLIKEFMMKQPRQIEVNLMDGGHRLLALTHGNQTTVQQLHQQMMKELCIPENCGRFFAIWICSKNLQLQLKPDHKPLMHLKDWKTDILPRWSNVEPSRQEPRLYWRRDARLRLDEERTVQNSIVIRLLFYEAYHYYITSFYPCSDKDTVYLASLFLQTILPNVEDTKAVKQFVQVDKNLSLLIPMEKVTKKRGWSQKIVAAIKEMASSKSLSRNSGVAEYQFLAFCWNFSVYGSAFFAAAWFEKARRGIDVHVGVNDVGIHLLRVDNKEHIKSFNYMKIRWSVQLVNDQRALEIQEIVEKGAARNVTCLATKQYDLINTLMNKLSNH